jgi:alpha-L-arabinofuranosidase
MNSTRFLLLVSMLFLLGTITSCLPEREVTQIKIDVNQTNAPIEKYIYGQFIEHLGKCIYGGIWAEMLEDRKFYYPVTYEFNPWATGEDEYWESGEFTFLNASPWEVIGTQNTVEMDSLHPFCGEHSVKVNIPGNGSAAGIKQARLAVEANRKYTGFVVVKGNKNVLPVIVQLKTLNGDVISHEINQISNNFEHYSFEFTPQFSSDDVALEIFSAGTGIFHIGTLSLMPDDNIKGWRRDVVALMKELDSPVYRWPGGNFVSGYNWMDGIGERDKRPPRKNPAWKGVEPNDVGIHEYMELMELLDAEPFIAVNTGLGTVEEVAREIEYCNSPVETEMGQLRAANGHPDPFNVKWWAVGNEMYGSWQLGHMPLEEYVKKHNQVAEAIWNVDPDAQLIGVGSVGEWSKTMLTESAEYMNLLSEHIYCKELDNVSDHIGQLASEIKRVADAHRAYRESIPGLAEKDICIAMDEWNYWYGPYIYGELGVRYHLKDALGVARGLHEYFRNSDIYFMANYAQTVNVIGCIKTTPTSAGFAATGLPLKLYRNHFGTIPVSIKNDNSALDIAVASTPDKDRITVAVVNSSDKPEYIEFDFENVEVSSTAKKWLIHHSDPESYNEPDKEPNLNIEASDFNFQNKPIAFPPYSISLYSFGTNVPHGE